MNLREAVANLIKVKGRHNTEIAYQKLVEAFDADKPEQEPVAWVETLENAQPHCVTDLKYCSVMQHERGEHLKYIPLHTAPPKIFCGCGDQIMPNDGAECGNCVAARNAVKPEPVAQVHVAEDYHPHVIWMEGINAACFDQEYLYITPPQREFIGLTDDDIEKIHYDIKCKGMGAYSTNDIYRAIEAKLKEKNT